MKKLLLIIVPLLLSGCSGLLSNSGIETAGKAIDRIPSDVGRFSAWAAAVYAQESTKQKLADIEIAEAQADKARAENTRVVADTPEKMAIASMLEMGKAMSKALVALAKKDEHQKTIPMPKGVIGESLDSLGGAVAKIADTPAAVASAVGITAVKMTGEMAKEIGDKVTVNGDENTVTTTKTNTVTSTTGADASITTEQAAPPMEEMIEEPIIEPVIEPVTVS